MKRSGLTKGNGLGVFHIHYGQGVGKTTTAVGWAIETAGNDLKVDFVQFMKSGNSGEVTILAKIPNVRYWCPGQHPFIMSHGPETVHYEHAAKALRYAYDAVERGTHLLVCDEILDTIIFELLEKEQVLDLVKVCKKKTDLLMTGRDASKEFIMLADYATKYIQIKHPYYRGAKARKGIEY